MSEHQWVTGESPEMRRWPAIAQSMCEGHYEMCLKCGVVRRKDGLNKPCKGQLPRITLRGSR